MSVTVLLTSPPAVRAEAAGIATAGLKRLASTHHGKATAREIW